MVRDARVSDYDEVIRLYRQLHPDDPVLDDAAGKALFDQIVDDDRLRLLVLEAEGAVVATTYLNVIPNLTRDAAPYAVIENVVVDEPLRGRGLGKALMAATLAAVWEAGCYKAMLLTGSSNAATHAFYRACGFADREKLGYVARPSAPAHP